MTDIVQHGKTCPIRIYRENTAIKEKVDNNIYLDNKIHYIQVRKQPFLAIYYRKCN